MQHGRRRIRIVRTRQGLPGRVTPGIVLVEIPGQWAHSVVSLIQASTEHRHGGLMVTNVGPSGHAARARMARGDVLLRYDGHDLDSVRTLQRLIEAHQDASSKKLIRIEAARGREDLVFEVLGGPLGITVSPLLPRSEVSKTSRSRRIPGRLSPTAAKAPNAIPPVIHSLEQARRHSAEHPALVVVAGELVRPLLRVLRAAERASRWRRKSAQSLLAAARVSSAGHFDGRS